MMPENGDAVRKVVPAAQASHRPRRRRAISDCPRAYNGPSSAGQAIRERYRRPGFVGQDWRA